MGRPKAAIPVNVPFATRTTQGERDALNALVAKWAEQRTAETGVPSAGDGVTLWFRTLIRKLAKDEGIEIVEPEAEPPAKPAKVTKKTATKRGR